MRPMRAFTEHPASVGETYGEHFRVAMSFAAPLARAAGASLVHAVFPFLCVTTASATVRRLNERLARRCAACHSGPAHRPDLFPPRPAPRPPGPALDPRGTALAFDPVI